MPGFQPSKRSWSDFQWVDWEIGAEFKDPENTVYKVAIDYADPASWLDLFYDFLAEPAIEEVAGFSLGLSDIHRACDQPVEAMAALLAARDQLKGLYAFKMGDLESDETELSWIQIGDLNPLLKAYSDLELLSIRGSGALSFGDLNMPELRSLTVLTGGLKAEVVRQIMIGYLPKLESLELYLGEPNYGATVSLEDFAPMLSGRLFPNLKSLGLKNSPFQDEIAQVLAASPFVGQLETLDLSEGTLTDAGAQALLESPWVRQLKTLDVSHHWMSDDMVSRLEALPIEVYAGDGHDPNDDWRFITFSE